MPYPPRLIQLYEEGRASYRRGAFFNIPGAPWRMWNGSAPVEINGETFYPNQAIEFQLPEYTQGTEALQMTVILAARSGWADMPQDIIQNIESYSYKGVIITLYDIYQDPDTGGVLYVEPMDVQWKIDVIRHVSSGDTQEIQAICNSIDIDAHRDGYRAANHEDQQRLSAGDLFFQYAIETKHEEFDVTFEADD